MREACSWQCTELGFEPSLSASKAHVVNQRLQRGPAIAGEMPVAGYCPCWDTKGTTCSSDVKRYSRGSKSLTPRVTQPVLGLKRIKF